MNKKLMNFVKERIEKEKQKSTTRTSKEIKKAKVRGISMICFVIALIGISVIYSLANQEVKMTVTQTPNIDVVLTKGRSAVDLTNFETDLKAALKSDGVDPDKVKISAVESTQVESQNTFTWTQDISSSIGSISIANDGKDVVMKGNTSNAGSNAIWIMPTKSQNQEFTFQYSINFGDSFNAAGMFLRVQQTNSTTLEGYMLSFNNANWKSAANGNNAAIWKFTYTIGAHTNITKTLVQSLNISTSGTLTVKATDSSIKVSGGGLASETEVKLPTLYGNGYGFFSDHYAHGCDQIGQFSLTGINLQAETIKNFNEVLTAPEWRSDSIRTMVNVTDENNEQFNSQTELSNIVARLLNDDISYIGWGTDTNKTQINNVISTNDGKGIYIDDTNYTKAITDTAAYIQTLITNQSATQYVIAGEDVNIGVTPSDITSNTTDSEYPNGRWKVEHEYNYFENPEGQYDKSGVYTDAVISNFEKPGKYTIYYEDTQITPGVVYAHRRPVASFTLGLDINKVTLTSTSYDLDKQSDNNGISEEAWSYKKTSDTNWTDGKLTTVDGKSSYMIKLKVKDFQETWSKEAIKYITPDTNSKPVASFNIVNDSMSIYDKLQTVDNSYDPSGTAITTYEWKVIKDDKEIYTGTTPLADYKEYGIGKYKMQLTITNKNNIVSDPYTRQFEVKADTTGPELIADPTSKETINDPINVSLKFTDKESGFKSYKYAITDSATAVANDASVTWSSDITKAEDIITIKTFLKKQYIHIIAEDNDGNKSAERILGDYYIEPRYNIAIKAADSTTKAGIKNVTFNVKGEYEDGSAINLGTYNSVTNSDGKVLINSVPLVKLNKITIETVSAPSGYTIPSYKTALLNTSSYSIVVDPTQTSADLGSTISSDGQTVTLQVNMDINSFDLDVINVDKSNSNIRLDNSIFELSYNGVTLDTKTTQNGEAILSGKIAGATKTGDYILTQTSVMEGYQKTSATTLKISFDSEGSLSTVAQGLIGTNSDVTIAKGTNIVTVANKRTLSQGFEVSANVTDGTKAAKKVVGSSYKLKVEGSNNLNYTTEAIESDANGDIAFTNLYGRGLLKLTFINEKAPDKYSKATVDKYVTINIDDEGTITSTNASMEGVFDRVADSTVYVKLTNIKKATMNSMKIKVLSKQDNSVGIEGINFEVRKVIDNSLVSTGSTDSNGLFEIKNLSNNGVGDVVYKIIPTATKQNGITLDTIMIDVGFNSVKKIISTEQVTNLNYVNAYYDEQGDEDAYKYVANVNIIGDVAPIEGKNKLVLSSVDSVTNSAVPGTEYKLQVLSSGSIYTFVYTSNDSGLIETKVPDTANILVRLIQIKAAKGYKLDYNEKEITLARNSTGTLTISDKTNIADENAKINESGDAYITDKISSLANSQVKMKITKTDNTGTATLGGVTFRVTEETAKYDKTVVTDRQGYVELPDLEITKEGKYTFKFKETATVESYELPANDLVVNMWFTKEGSIVKYAGYSIVGSDNNVSSKECTYDAEKNEVNLNLKLTNKKKTEIDMTSMYYDLNIVKKNAKGGIITGSKYNIDIRPYASRDITYSNIAITDATEVTDLNLPMDEKKTSTILLNETTAALGYNLEEDFKVISLYYDGSTITYDAKTTTGSNMNIEISNPVIQNGAKRVTITVTIITPDPTIVKNPTTDTDDSLITYDLDLVEQDNYKQPIYGSKYDLNIAPYASQYSVNKSAIELTKNKEISSGTLHVSKDTTTTFSLAEVSAASGYNLDKTLKTAQLKYDGSTLSKIDGTCSDGVDITATYDSTANKYLITITVKTPATASTDPEMTDPLIYDIDITKQNSKGEKINGAKYDVSVTPYASKQEINTVTVKDGAEIIGGKLPTNKDSTTTIVLSEKEAETNYNLDLNDKVIHLKYDGTAIKTTGYPSGMTVGDPKYDATTKKYTIAITITIPEENADKPKTDNTGDVTATYDLDIVEQDSKGNVINGAKYDVNVRPYEAQYNTSSTNLEVTNSIEVPNGTLHLKKDTVTTFELTKTTPATDQKTDKETKMVQIKYDGTNTLSPVVATTSKGISINPKYDVGTNKYVIVITITVPDTEPATPKITEPLYYDLDIVEKDSNGNAINGAQYNVDVHPYGLEKETKTVTIKDGVEIADKTLPTNANSITTIALAETSAATGYDLNGQVLIERLNYAGTDTNMTWVKDNSSADAEGVNVEIKPDTTNTKKVIITITITVKTPSTPTNTEDATFAVKLFNKQQGDWTYNYQSYNEYYYYSKNLGRSGAYISSDTLTGAQKLQRFFKNSASNGFTQLKGTVTKGTAQLIENGTTSSNIYEEIISSPVENVTPDGETDNIKFKKDYTNKEVLFTITELMPAYNYKRIGEMQVRVKFDENGKVKSGSITEGSDLVDMAVGGISAEGQVEKIQQTKDKINKYNLAGYYYGWYWQYFGSYSEYEETDINAYNSIGTNNLYVGVLNKAVTNPQTVEINLKDADTDEGLQDGQFNVTTKTLEQDGVTWDNAETAANGTTTTNGVLKIVAQNTYANRTVQYQITQTQAPTIGVKKFKDNVKETLTFNITFDDEGKMQTVQAVHVPTNMNYSVDAGSSSQTSENNGTINVSSDSANKVTVNAYNELDYNFCINLTKVDENGNPLSGVKVHHVTKLIKDANKEGEQLFEYTSGLTDAMGKAALKICLPETATSNYYSKTLEIDLDEIYVPDNYKALEGIKIQVLFDAIGNPIQTQVISDNTTTQSTVGTGKSLNVTLHNVKVESKPTFQITEVDSEDENTKIEGKQYKILSWDDNEYQKGTLTYRDTTIGNKTDANGYTEVVMDNAHALRTITYTLQEITTPDSYLTNEDIKVRVVYDRNGKVVSTPEILTKQKIDRKEAITIKGNPIGSSNIQVQIINEMKPKFTINIQKYLKVYSSANYREMPYDKDIFKATSQVKQADGSYAESTETRESLETSTRGITKVGFKKAHNSQTVLYTIYEVNDTVEIQRGTVEVAFDVDGNVKSQLVSGDYLQTVSSPESVNYINVKVENEAFKAKIQLQQIGDATYNLGGASFTVTTTMGENNDRTKTLTTDSTYGIVTEEIGEVYKNKTIIYSFHQDAEPNDFNKVDDFQITVTFDANGNITSATPTNEENKFAITTTSRDTSTGANLSIIVYQQPTDRQKIEMNLYNEKNPTIKIGSATYVINSSKVQKSIYNLNVSDGIGDTDLGPDKGFAGATILYTFTEKSVSAQDNVEYIVNPKTIQVSVDYNLTNGTIDNARIVANDDYATIDTSCYGSKTLKIATLNREKIKGKIANINLFKDDEKLANNSYTVTTVGQTPNYDDTKITDLSGEATITAGPYYKGQTVTYRITQNNQPTEFTKLPNSTFTVTYNNDGFAESASTTSANLAVEVPTVDNQKADGGYNFKVTVKSEPQMTVGVQTTDAADNTSKITGGKFTILDQSSNATSTITTQSDKIAHAGLGKTAQGTKYYSIVEKEAPLGYQYIKGKDIKIGVLKVEYDTDGHIIAGSPTITEGYDYIKIISGTDKLSIYDVDISISYNQTQEFKVIIEDQSTLDNTIKLASTFTAVLSGTTKNTTTTEDTGLGELNFGTVARETTQNLTITQSNIKGNYLAVGTISMNIKFDGSSKIASCTPNSGSGYASSGVAYTVDSAVNYTLKITVKNNPIVKITVTNVNDGNKDQLLQGTFQLSGQGTNAALITTNELGYAETYIDSVPKNTYVDYVFKQTSINKSYELVKPIDIRTNYSQDGKITSASLYQSGDSYADSSAVEVVSYDQYNINIKVKNKQTLTVYVNTIDKFDPSLKLSDLTVSVKEETYTKTEKQLKTDSNGEASVNLGSNKPGQTLMYTVKILNPSAEYQQNASGYITASITVNFGTDGKITSTKSSNEEYVEASYSDGLALVLTAKYTPLLNMEISRTDGGNKSPLSGRTITVSGSTITQQTTVTTDTSGKASCKAGIIKTPTVRYNLSEQNQDKENYADLTSLYVDVTYDELGKIANIVPSDGNIITTSGIGTRKLSLNINSTRKCKISLTDVDYLQNATRIAGTYEITSSKGEKTQISVATTNQQFATIGNMYPGEDVTYVIHQTGTAQRGYETIPDVSFVVTYDGFGNASKVTPKDDRIKQIGSIRTTASQTTAHIDLQLGSKAQLLVQLKLKDKLYNQGVGNIGFKIKDGKSGIEKTIDKLSDNEGILEIPVDSVYSNEIVDYTLTQTETKGGYKKVDPIEIIVQYEEAGTISLKGTYIQNSKIASLSSDYSKNLYKDSKLIGIQVAINMESEIGLGIENIDQSTGKTISGIEFSVQEKEITTEAKENSYTMTTDANGESTKYGRDVNGTIKCVEYSIKEIQPAQGYHTTKAFKFRVNFNTDGRIISMVKVEPTENEDPDITTIPDNVTIQVSSNALLQMTGSQEMVHIKVTVADNDRMTLKIVHEDKQINGLGIKGSVFNVSYKTDDVMKVSGQSITTNSKGIATLSGIEGPGNVKIYFNQIDHGEGYETNQANAGFVEVEKAKDKYVITQVDSTAGINWEINNQMGEIIIHLKDENKLKLNIYSADLTTNAVVKGTTIKVKAQIGELSEDDNTITAKTDNVKDNGQYVDSEGSLGLDFGNTYDCLNKKLVFTITSVSTPQEYSTISNIVFNLEIDSHGRIAKFNGNTRRIMNSKTVDPYTQEIYIGYGNIPGTYTVKIAKETEGNSDAKYRRINGATFNVDLSVDGNSKATYDLTTESKKIGNSDEAEKGIAEIKELNYNGLVTLTLTETGTVEGYTGLEKPVKVSFACQYDYTDKTNPTFILINDSKTTDNPDKVKINIDNIQQTVTITVLNTPTFSINVTNEDPSHNLIAGAKYDVTVEDENDLDSLTDYGTQTTSSEGTFSVNIPRTYYGKTLLITLTQDKLSGFESINPILIEVYVGEDGTISSTPVPAITAGADFAKISEYGKYKINVLIRNVEEKDFPKLTVKLTKQSSANENIKLKDVGFQIRITPEEGTVLYKFQKTDENGQIILNDLTVTGNIKIELAETAAPEGYILGDNEGRYSFTLIKNDTKSTLTKGTSNLDDSLWSLDSANNLVELNIPNEPDAVELAVNKVDEKNGMSIKGVKFKLIDMQTNNEYEQTTNAAGMAIFSLQKKISGTGSYKVIEETTPQGYTTNSSEMPLSVDFDANGNATKATSSSSGMTVEKQGSKYIQCKVINKQSDIGVKPYNVEIVNVDKEDKTLAIRGSQFKVNINEEVGATGLQTTKDVDEDGKISINTVNGAGAIKILVNEIKAGYGYARDTTTKSVALSRNAKDGSITITDMQNATAEYDSTTNTVRIYVTNEKESGKYSLVIDKIDEKGNNITASETQMEVKIGDNAAKIYTTDKNGRIIISNLDLPNAQNFDILITEKVAPTGYSINDRIQTLTISTTTKYDQKEILGVAKTDTANIEVKNRSSNYIELTMQDVGANGDLYLSSDKYTVSDEYVERVSPYTKASDYITKMSSNGKMTILDKSGNTVGADSYVGTGMVIKAEKDGQTISKAISVIGDATGDGKITALDSSKMKQHVIGKKLLEGEYFKAMDITNDGKISALDMSKLQKNILGQLQF